MEDLETEVRKLTPDDGDVLVLRSPRPLRMEHRAILNEMIAQLIERIGKRVTFLVLEDGMSIELLKTSQLPDKVAA